MIWQNNPNFSSQLLVEVVVLFTMKRTKVISIIYALNPDTVEISTIAFIFYAVCTKIVVNILNSFPPLLYSITKVTS
jgi:hypothetical protein